MSGAPPPPPPQIVEPTPASTTGIADANDMVSAGAVSQIEESVPESTCVLITNDSMNDSASQIEKSTNISSSNEDVDAAKPQVQSIVITIQDTDAEATSPESQEPQQVFVNIPDNDSFDMDAFFEQLVRNTQDDGDS